MERFWFCTEYDSCFCGEIKYIRNVGVQYIPDYAFGDIISNIIYNIVLKKITCSSIVLRSIENDVDSHNNFVSFKAQCTRNCSCQYRKIVRLSQVGSAYTWYRTA